MLMPDVAASPFSVRDEGLAGGLIVSKKEFGECANPSETSRVTIALPTTPAAGTMRTRRTASSAVVLAVIEATRAAGLLDPETATLVNGESMSATTTSSSRG